MCVPESALRHYYAELDREYIARMNGYDDPDEYDMARQDDIENDAYDNWKDSQLSGES